MEMELKTAATSASGSAVRRAAASSSALQAKKGGKIHSLELAKLRKIEMEKYEEARKAQRDSVKAEIEKRKKEREEIKMKEEAKRMKEEKKMLKEMVDLSKNLKALRKELKSNKLAVKCAGSRVESPSIQAKPLVKKEGQIHSLEISKLRKIEMDNQEKAKRAHKESVKAEIVKRKKERVDEKKKEEVKKIEAEKKLIKEMMQLNKDVKNLGKKVKTASKLAVKKPTKPRQIAAINAPSHEVITVLSSEAPAESSPVPKEAALSVSLNCGLDGFDGKSDSDREFELPIGVWRKMGNGGFGFGLSDSCTGASSNSASSLGFETESDLSGCDLD